MVNFIDYDNGGDKPSKKAGKSIKANSSTVGMKKTVKSMPMKRTLTKK